MSEEEMEQEKPSFFTRIKQYLSGAEKDEEDAVYQRKLLDGRIEKYLDRHAESYITEFGLVTSLDIQAYEQRYNKLSTRVTGLLDFAKNADAEVTNLERRLKSVKAASRSRK
jgi:hypothetical protein